MQAHEVPTVLFDKLAAKAEAEGQAKREERLVEGREATVIHLGAGIWLSVETSVRVGSPMASSFRLWASEPARESDLFVAPEPVLIVYGGPRSVGWGEDPDKWQTEVMIAYGRGSRVDVTKERGRFVLECAMGVVAAAMLLARDVGKAEAA